MELRRCLTISMLTFVLSLLSLSGAVYAAEEYPSKPIKLVVPWPVGGVTDVAARIIGDRLGRVIGQPIIVDNKPGGTGIIGTDAVAKAAPDGYTLLLVSASTHAISPHLMKLPYDIEKNFAPIAQLTSSPAILVVPPTLSANTVSELVAMAKANPGKLAYASFGNGSSAHLAAEVFKQVTGTNMLHVPYKGAAPAITDLQAGRVSLFFDSIPSSMPHVKSGRLKALAVTGSSRVAALPEVPTIAESYPGFDVTVWQGIEAPAGTPRSIIDKLNAELVKVMRMPDIRESLQRLGAEPMCTTPEQFAQHITHEREKWGAVIRAGNIKLDQ